MKKILAILGTIVLLIILLKCEKDGSNISEGSLTLVKTIPGGCNIQNSPSLKSLAFNEKDTVIISLRKDTIDLFVGVNYICCAPFKSTVAMSGDSIIINLTDTCSGSSPCYCHCDCYYTWDFLLTGFIEKTYHFKIILFNPRKANPVIVKEGDITIELIK